MAEGADTTSQAEKNAQSYNIVTTLWGIAAVVNLGSLVLSPLTASMRAPRGKTLAPSSREPFPAILALHNGVREHLLLQQDRNTENSQLLLSWPRLRRTATTL